MFLIGDLFVRQKSFVSRQAESFKHKQTCSGGSNVRTYLSFKHICLSKYLIFQLHPFLKQRSENSLSWSWCFRLLIEALFVCDSSLVGISCP